MSFTKQKSIATKHHVEPGQSTGNGKRGHIGPPRNGVKSRSYSRRSKKSATHSIKNKLSRRRKTPIFSEQLAVVNPGRLHPSNRPGPVNSISGDTGANRFSLPETKQKERFLDRSRGSGNDKKDGHQGSFSLFRSISEPCLSCPKEGWRTETSNQSEKAESVCGITFQNGGNSDLEISHKERGFHGQTGPERCIFRGSDRSSTSQVYPFLLAREDLRIPSPAIWPRGTTPLLYQASKAGNCFPQENRSETCRLLRRHDTAESMQTYADTGLVFSEMASGKSGIPNKLEEIRLCPHTSNPVLGIPGRFSGDGHSSPSKENSENYSEMPVPRLLKGNKSTENLRGLGPDDIIFASNSPSTPS